MKEKKYALCPNHEECTVPCMHSEIHEHDPVCDSICEHSGTPCSTVIITPNMFKEKS